MKRLVPESLNEVFHFERSSSDPLKNLSVGKRAQIIKWLDSFGIKNYTINDDLTIDVKGSVKLINQSLTCFPSFIKFNKVSDSFYCSGNQLNSLEGCPITVGSNFFCRNNQLTSLEGCPTTVGGSFYCYSNQLTSLEGCPIIVGGSFSCYNNTKKFSEEDVRSLCKVEGDIFI
jgi:hypothetical protein